MPLSPKEEIQVWKTNYLQSLEKMVKEEKAAGKYITEELLEYRDWLLNGIVTTSVLLVVASILGVVLAMMSGQGMTQLAKNVISIGNTLAIGILVFTVHKLKKTIKEVGGAIAQREQRTLIFIREAADIKEQTLVACNLESAEAKERFYVYLGEIAEKAK